MSTLPLILLLSGSLRAGSSNEAVLRTAQAVAASQVRTAVYEGLAALPHFNPDDDTDPLPAPVVELRAAIGEAAAVLICTPEYAGTLPGAFKNLLDWTIGGTEICDKPVAWVNAASPDVVRVRRPRCDSYSATPEPPSWNRPAPGFRWPLIWSAPTDSSPIRMCASRWAKCLPY